MLQKQTGAKVDYVCPTCMEVVNGTPEDARVSISLVTAAETSEMHTSLIMHAAEDITNHLVSQPPCPGVDGGPPCGLTYVAQLRLGAEEKAIHVCKCGRQS